MRIVGRWFTRIIRDDIPDLFYCRMADILDFMTMKTIVRQVCTGICAAPAFRRGATKAEARRTEPCGIRRMSAIFRLSEWKAYNVLKIHSENDRDVVRFEKAHSEHRISRLKMLAAIERNRMDRLRKKLGKIISGDRYPNRSLITK